MDSFTTNISEELLGLEVLTLEGVELLKRKEGKNYFLTIGDLTVVYVGEYKRFVIYLKEWAYGLLKRIPVTCVYNNTTFKYFVFPSYSSQYILKIRTDRYPAAVKNIETILRHNSIYTEEEEGKHFSGNSRRRYLNEFIDNYYLTASSEQIGRDYIQMSGSKYDKLSMTDIFRKGLNKIVNKLKGHPVDQLKNPKLVSLYDYSYLKDMVFDPMFEHTFVRKDIDAVILRSKDIAQKLGSDTYYEEAHQVPRGSITHHAGTHQEQFKSTPVKQLIFSSNEKTNRESPKAAQIPKRIFTPGSLMEGQHSGNTGRSTKESRVTYASTVTTRSSLTYEEYLEEEKRILREIEKERKAQLNEKREQELHRAKELGFIAQERVLLEEIRKLLHVENPEVVEKRIQEEMSERDSEIAMIRKLREFEFKKFEKREKQLLDNLDLKLAEIRRKETLLMIQRQVFEKRETELVEIGKLKEIINIEVRQVKEAELSQLAVEMEERIRKQEEYLELKRLEIQQREREICAEAEDRLVEIVKNQEMIEEGEIDFANKEQELIRLFRLVEEERLQLENNKKGLEKEAKNRLSQLTERMNQAESELSDIAKMRIQLQETQEKTMIDLSQREKLTEFEREELLKKQEELKNAFELAEGEVLSLIVREKKLQEQLQEKEGELAEKLRLTEAEEAEMYRIKKELAELNFLHEADREELNKQKEELMLEVERRNQQLVEREKLNEEQYNELMLKEIQLKTDLQMRMDELNRKEQLTESEYLELKNREKELTRIRSLHEMEMKRSDSDTLNKIKLMERELMVKSQELLSGELTLNKHIENLDQDIQRAGRVQVHEMTEKQVSFGDPQLVGEN